VGSDDQPSPIGWVGDLGLDDSREDEIAERAAAVPALVAALGDLDRRLGVRIEIRQRRKPVDAREAMALLATALRFEKVIGKRRRVLGREAEGA